MLGTSYNTNKYAYESVDSSNDNVNYLKDISIKNGEHSVTQKMNVILDDVSLERVHSMKFLGVIIDENLTWKNHIDAISKIILETLECLAK